MDPSTLLIHGLDDIELGEPSVQPPVLASFFTSAGTPEPGIPSYGRDGNPTWDALEQLLGGLEDADALVFASGQAATTALILALSERSPRLVMPVDGYYGARKLAELLGPRGVEHQLVDLADHDAVARALAKGPSVLWAESPTNPLLRVFDLEALARIAHQAGAPLVVDNTTATAVLQQPLDLGAAACLTSLTKSASGHSDLLMGAVTTRDPDLLARVRTWRHLAGGIAGPFEAWLAIRGIRTLALRIERQSTTALRLARWLREQPSVSSVHYPGLDPSTAALAERQMRGGFGPLLSFEVRGGAAAADAVISCSKLVKPGTSFGGYQSSWERRARWASESAPESLIRLSVGLERAEDLIEDIDGALRRGAR
jgi:cystathionine gamma-synthase